MQFNKFTVVTSTDASTVVTSTDASTGTKTTEEITSNSIQGKFLLSFINIHQKIF